MRLKRLKTLVYREFIEFYSSKAWIVVLIMPLFIAFLYAVVYRQAEAETSTIAYPQTLQEPVKRIFSMPQIKLMPYQNLKEAKRSLQQGKVDGIILPSRLASNQITILVDKTKAKQTLFIVNNFNVALINAYTKQTIPQLKLVYINKTVPLRWLSLPTWLLQIILTVCLLQAASTIADEKERQTLHSLLVSPMSFMEYLVAKLIWNTLVGVGAIVITLLLIGSSLQWGSILAFSFWGCMVYTAISITIGLFAPSALFARTTATLVYIISAIPLMIKDLSFTWKAGLNIFPSYLTLIGLEQALVKTANPFNLLAYQTGLFLETFVLIGISYFVLKHKADF